MIDTHCHILPGLDDGPADLETALTMARIAEHDGIRAIIATPHVGANGSRLTPDIIRERTAAFNEALQQAAIQLTVYPGAEVRITDTLCQELEAGEHMTLADRGKHLLIELPFNSYPAYAGELFFNLQVMGIIPVLAHPERTAMLRAHPEVVWGLADRGALLQVNLDSLQGRAGWGVRLQALRLLKRGAVHLLASDAHDPRNRPPILSTARKVLRRLGGEEAFQRLVIAGPQSLLQ
jgi:protein-tyrosine phosphatase